MAENNGSLAEVQLTVAVDKKKYFNQLKKMFQDSQAECDNNALTVTFQSDRSSIENIIKQLDGYDFSANVTLESNVAELKGHLEDVLAHMDMTVPVTADTSALDKKLAEEESKLEELKKKQRKSVAELAKELDTLASKTTDKNFDKNAKKALQLYNAIKDAGGNIRSVKDQKTRDFITEAQGYKEYVDFAKQNPLTFVDEAEIQAQIKVIEDLKQEIEKTKQAAREAGAQGTGTGGGTSAKVGTEPDVNAEEFAKKVSEQLTIPAKIGIEPDVDAEKFAKKVSEQLTLPAELAVQGNVDSPEEFASEISKQLSSPATIPVLGEVSNPQEFADEVSKQLTVPVNVGVTTSKSEPSSTGSNVDNSLETDSELKNRIDNYQRAIENLREYIELQKKIKADPAILPGYINHERSLYVSANDLHKDGTPTKTSVKRQLSEYLDSSSQRNFVTLAAYVNALKDAEAAEKIFGKSHADLFKQVMDYIDQAKVSLNAYKEAESSLNAGKWNLREAGLEGLTLGASDKLESLLQKDGVEAAIEYLKKELGFEIPQAVERTTSSIAESARETAEQTQLAVNAVEAEGDAAKEAAKWKEEFATANKAVAQASEETAEKTKEAAEEVRAEGEAAEKAAESNKSFKENADLLRYLKEIQQGTNTIQFGISIDKEMADAELRKIAPEIARSFNDKYGTNLTGAQVVKAYKASLKEQQAADEAALQAHLETMEKRTQADDAAFQKQVQNWKDYIQQTEKARQENEEYRQLRAYDDAMAYANQQAADELEYQQKLAMYKAQGAAQIKEIIAEEKEHAAWVEEVCKKQEESNALMQKQLDEAEQLAVYDMAMEYAHQQAAEEAEYLKKRNEYLEYGRQQQQEYLRQAQEIARTFDNADKAQEFSSTQHNKEAAKAYDKLFSSAKEYYNLLMKQENVRLSADEAAELERLQKEWDAATSAVGKYSIEVNGTTDSINRATSAQTRFNNEAKNSSVSGILKNLQSSYDKIQNMIGSGKYTSAFVIELAEVQSQIREIMSTPLDLDDAAIRSKLAQLRVNIDESIGKKAFSDVKKAASSSLSKLELQINQFTNQNTGMGLKFRQQFENLRIRLTDAKSVADVERLASSIVKLKSEVESAGRATRSFFDILRERIVGINAQAIAQYFSWQDWIRYIRRMATTVTQLDTALTEMRKVSDESLTSLQAYQRETFETADAVGTTALALQQSTADWMRLGEAQEQAAKSARAATVLMNVSEFQSIDEATQSLVAVSQAYKDIDKMDIIDVINNIGNNYSVATNELAQGLQNAAAVLKTQGNDLNEAVALLTAGNAITQDISKTSAGIRTISLRIAGTQEAKDQLAELGEEVDDFIVQTESKTQKLIKDYTAVASNAYKGIDVLDANGNLRNTYDILLDIARIYKEIQEEDLRAGTNRAQALVEYIAGKNRSNIAASILLNPEMLENVYNSALDSTGSAERELAKYLESIEGHIAKFQTQLQELEFDLLDSNTIKTFINLGTGALSVIDALVDSLGLLGTLGTAMAIAAATKNFGVFKTTLDETSASGLRITTVFNDLSTALNNSRQFAFSAEYAQSITEAETAFGKYISDVEAGVDPQEAFNHILMTGNEELIEYASKYDVTAKSLDTFVNSQAKAQVSLMAQNTTLTNTSSLIQGYNNSVAATGLSQREFASAVMATNGTLGQYLINLGNAEASMSGYLFYIVKTTAATVAMRAVTMGLNAVIGMAVSWLINKAVKAWDDYIHRVDNAKAALEEFEDKNKELLSGLEKQSDTIKNLSDSYFDLSKGVDSVTGKNVSLSTDDYNEFIQMNEELADAFPKLISHVDEYGHRFVDLGDNAAYAKKKLEEFYKQEEENYQYELYKGLPEMFKNEQIVMDDIQGDIDEIEASLSRSSAALMQIQNAVNFTSGDMINVVAEYGDDAATAYAQAFRNAYVEAMNQAITDGDSDLANKLNDALLDTSTEGQYSFAVNLTSLGQKEREYLQNYFADFKDNYTKGLDDSIADISKQLEIKRKEYDSEWQRILPSLVGSAKYMADEETQELAAAFVGSLSSDIYEEIKDRPIEVVMREWLGDISKMSMDDRLKLESILDTSLSPEERVRIYKELQASLNEKNITLPVELVVKDDQELINRVDVSKARLTGNFKDRADLNAFFDDMSIDTREEYELWLDVTRGIDDATEAMQAYKDALSQVVTESDKVKPTLVGAATTLNTKIKPAVDSLGELYKTIFYSSDGRNATGAFDISKLDPSQLAGIKENFITNLTELGITFDDAEKKVNKFFEALSNPNANKDSVQKAFNEILTEYFYAADGLSDLSEETADGLKKMLKAMDVTNADEVVDNALNTVTKVNDALKKAEDIDFEPKIADALKNLKAEQQKISDWELDEYADEIMSGTIQAKYGNVDMDKRTIIHYNDEILDTFKDALDSWPEYDEEGNPIGSYYDHLVEEVKKGNDAIDTVFGGSDPFELDGQEIEVAFTPIMVDENGNNPQFLSSGTVKNYIQNVLEQADKEVEASGEEWSQEAVIKKALEIDLKGMDTQEIDSQGRVVGTTFVHGVIAAIGDEALDVGSLLHFSGDFGAWEIAQEKLDAYNSLKEKVANGTLSLSNVTATEIEILQQEGYVTEAVAKQMALLALQEQLAATTNISTDGNVAELADLAKWAGMTAAEVEVLNEAMRLFGAATAAEKSGKSGGFEAGTAMRNQANQMLDNFKAEVQRRAQENLNFDLNFGPKNTESAGSGGKDAADAYVEAFEKELKALEEQRDAGIITEKQFLDKYKALIEKYFKDVDGYGEEYAKRMGDYFQRAISYYESVFSAVGTLLDKRISAAQEGKDAAISAIEAERDAVLAAYDAQLDAIDALIDAKQDELDRLRDEHDQRARNLSLMKAQYELQRAQQQKVRLIYKDGQMVKIVPSINDTISVKG